MKQDIPTRAIVVDRLRELTTGVNPIKIALWAESFDYPENAEISSLLEQNDPKLRELISDLSMAAAIGDGNSFLYDKDDFKEWLKEFETDSAKS
jgi:hypothetical protein